MQELTSDDIYQYVHSELKAGHSFIQRIKDGAEFENLVTTLARKADGVWLWAKHAAVVVVFDGLDLGENVGHIMVRAAMLPEDLEYFYERDLNAIDLRVRPEAAKIMLMSLRANEPMPILTLFLSGNLQSSPSDATHDVPDEEFDMLDNQLKAILTLPDSNVMEKSERLGDWSQNEIVTLLTKPEIRQALLGRCQQFLVLSPTPTRSDRALSIEQNVESSATRHRLVFGHRSYRDFLISRRHRLYEWTKCDFSVTERLIKAYSTHYQLCCMRFRAREYQEPASAQRESLVGLLVSIMSNAAELQGGKSDVSASALGQLEELDARDDEFLASNSFATRYTTTSDGSSASTPKTTWSSQINSYFHSNIEQWLDRCIISPRYTNETFQRVGSLFGAVQQRQALEADCDKADPTGSLWIIMHGVPLAMVKQSDINQMRGNASVWGCWLQCLFNLKSRGSQYDGRLRQKMQSLTALLLAHGADEKHMVRKGSERELPVPRNPDAPAEGDSLQADDYATGNPSTKVLQYVFEGDEHRELLAKVVPKYRTKARMLGHSSSAHAVEWLRSFIL